MQQGLLDGLAGALPEGSGVSLVGEAEQAETAFAGVPDGELAEEVEAVQGAVDL